VTAMVVVEGSLLGMLSCCEILPVDLACSSERRVATDYHMTPNDMGRLASKSILIVLMKTCRSVPGVIAFSTFLFEPLFLYFSARTAREFGFTPITGHQ